MEVSPLNSLIFIKSKRRSIAEYFKYGEKRIARLQSADITGQK